ncbi:MAG: hypothetical protein K9L66_00900 [Spirochaetaceae bacterium]|nr:hypothetical protein [Spirochaetaceae bacterium]MCF7947278.1 hypothetical protein [Spirochaetia bacterium]MCF7950171.1 hypothetical protein [Spirochaetaceae bacterium]
MKRRIVVFTALFILLPALVSGLTLEQGRIKLILHENNGRFSIYYLKDIEKEEYVSLLFERDPRTSSTGILQNNRVHTLGSSNAFSQKVRKTSEGAQFIWSSSKLEIQQTFSFVKSSPNSLVDGIRIDTAVANNSESTQSVGIHHLFDTYLGEKQDAHFITSDDQQLEGETGFSLQPPSYWVSPVSSKTEEKSGSFEGFVSMLKGSGITLPDKVVFSNWKRLSENLWNLQIQGNRNFNLLPYSINDSAVCQFYDPIKLKPGGTRTITAVVGAFTGSPLRVGSTVTTQSEEESQASLDRLISRTREGDSQAVKEMVREDLVAVNDIISQINSLLSFPEDISEEKIAVIERALKNLREKQKQYKNSE